MPSLSSSRKPSAALFVLNPGRPASQVLGKPSRSVSARITKVALALTVATVPDKLVTDALTLLDWAPNDKLVMMKVEFVTPLMIIPLFTLKPFVRQRKVSGEEPLTATVNTALPPSTAVTIVAGCKTKAGFTTVDRFTASLCTTRKLSRATQ